MKRFYDCIEADKTCIRNRKIPRTFKGINTTNLKTIDAIVGKDVALGQSLHHIYVVNNCLHEICSERTIRRYVYRGYLSIRAHEFARFVRFPHKYDYKKL